MKTRITFFQAKAASDRLQSRRRLMINFNVNELAHSNEQTAVKLRENISRKFAITDVGKDPDFLKPIYSKLKVDAEMDVCEFQKDDQTIYLVTARTETYKGELDGALELGYRVVKNNNDATFTYQLLTFDTDNIFIFNAVNSIEDVTDELKEDAKQNVADLGKTEEEKLRIAIQNLLPGNEGMKAEAEKVLALVESYKYRNSNTAYKQELDEALQCTREFISTIPYCKPEHADLLSDPKEKATNLATMASKFQRQSRNKVLGGLLISLLAAAVVAVCVTAIVFSFGAAIIPIAVMAVAATAGGVSAFTLFHYANDDRVLKNAMLGTVNAPQPLPSIEI